MAGMGKRLTAASRHSGKHLAALKQVINGSVDLCSVLVSMRFLSCRKPGSDSRSPYVREARVLGLGTTYRGESRALKIARDVTYPQIDG